MGQGGGTERGWAPARWAKSGCRIELAPNCPQTSSLPSWFFCLAPSRSWCQAVGMPKSAGSPGQTPPELKFVGAAWGRHLLLPRASSSKAVFSHLVFVPQPPSLPLSHLCHRRRESGIFVSGCRAGAHPTCSQHPCLGRAVVAGAMVMM